MVILLSPAWQASPLAYMPASLVNGADRPHIVASRHEGRVSRRRTYIARIHRTQKVEKTQTAIKTAVATLGPVKKPVVKPATTKGPIVVQKPETLVALSFVRPDGRPLRDMPVAIDILDRADKLVKTQTLETGDDGKISLKLTQFPVVLHTRIDKEGWAIAEPVQSVVAVRETDGLRVAQMEDNPVLWAALDNDLMPMLMAQTKKAQTQKTKTVIVRRSVKPSPIVVEREEADLALSGQPGTLVALGEEKLGTIDASGTLQMTLPADRIPSDGSTLVLERKESGRTFGGECLLKPLDPYAPNAVSLPGLKLESLEDVRIGTVELSEAGLPLADSFTRMFGKPSKEKIPVAPKAPRGQKPMQQTAGWWTFGKSGVEAKVRPIYQGEKRLLDVAERVRLTSADAGSVGGFSVGASRGEVESAFGPGDEPLFPPDPNDMRERRARLAGNTVSYLGDGVRFTYEDGKIAVIDLLRPNSTIRTGIETRRPDRPLAIAFGRFTAGTDVPDEMLAEARTWFVTNPGFTLTENPEDADFVLDFEIVGTTATRHKALELVQTKADIETVVRYRVRDPLGGEADWRTARRSARADYTGDAVGTTLLGGLLGGIIDKASGGKGTTGVAAGAAAGAAAANERVRAMLDRAIPRLQEVTLRGGVADALAEIANRDLMALRVSSVNPTDGTVTLDAGSRHGIRRGNEFELTNGGLAAFPSKDDTKGEDRVILRVDEVGEETATGALIHVKASLSNTGWARSEEKPEPWTVFGLLAPETRQVTATRILRVAG